jgi:succinyl-diaminopimelate desuccinylase
MLFIDKNSKLVATCLSIYRKHSGDYHAEPYCIGGGTFARVAPNLVAFGPHFPNQPKPSNIHNKDENMSLEDLYKATIIYAEALYELAK